jgi:hypothetical protein
MTPEQEEAIKLEQNLDEARRDLHATAEQMLQKVEEAGAELRPDRVLFSRYPAAVIGVTAAIGFIAGSTLDAIFEPVVVGLLLGYGTAKLIEMGGDSDRGK